MPVAETVPAPYPNCCTMIIAQLYVVHPKHAGRLFTYVLTIMRR
jgi:hypothetical protein